jgi:hypothetical protein
MACRTWPQSGWPPAPPGCGRRTPAWTTRLRRSVPPADTRQWLAGWRTWRTSRASGRPDIPVQCDRPAMGTDPVRTAAAKRRTPPAPSVRPCVWPPGHGQPRGVHVLALTGQDGNAHAPFGQPQQLPASGPVRRDHLHPMLDAERPQAWSPSDVRAVVSGVHDGHPDRTGFGHRPPRRIRPDTVHSTRHAMANQKRRGQGTDERHRRRSDILDRHHHMAAHRDTPSPLLWGRRLRLGNQGWLGDGKTASTTVTTAATK